MTLPADESIELSRAAQSQPVSSFTRRALLSFGAAGVASAAGLFLTAGSARSAFPFRTNSSDAAWDTIIIGAGASGLGAARVLTDGGKRVLILEARNRIGGRMWTDSDSMSIPVERGCELIHGANASTWDIVAEQNLQTVPIANYWARNNPSQPWLNGLHWEYYVFPLGSPFPSPDAVPAANPGENALTWMNRVGIQRDNLPAAIAAWEVDGEQFADSTASNGLISEIQDCVEVTLDPTLRGYAGEDNADDFRVIGGYQQVLLPLLVGAEIIHESVVHQIDYSDKGAEVHASTGSYRAHTVIIAVPGPVLKSGAITFNPPLPNGREDAFQLIKPMSVFKAIFEFAHPILPENLAVDQPGATAWDYMESYDGNPGCFWNASRGTPGFSGEVVVGWMTGKKAQDLLDMPETQRLSYTLSTLRSSVGDQGLHPVAQSTYDWSKDPFALGAYGGSGGRDQSKEPVDNVLFWAGMTTSTVAASRNSGIAQAELILALPERPMEPTKPEVILPVKPGNPKAPTKPVLVVTGR